MKKARLLVLTLLSILTVCLLSLSSKTVKAEDTNIDWMPFNYVLTDGFGSAMKYYDVRTNLSIENGKITASGRTTKGGMGMTYLPEININNFSMNISVNSWQEVSPDRWFGMTLTDVGVKSDEYNEAPFYSKHSESWSVDYGAGILFAFRPNENGAMQIQFNFIGINDTYDADYKVASNAGEYNDGHLGWGGWLSTIQLCNEDWTDKTDYKNINITLKEIVEGEKSAGYAFDINNGYWKRTDAIDWSNLASDVFALLDKDSNGSLSDSEKDNFIYGPAYETSVIPYANWGESFYALTKFKNIVETQEKRLYMSFMYKDTWDLRDGVDDASFTINSINGNAATTMSEFPRINAKNVEGKISGKVEVDNFHAGIYPDMIKSFKMVDAPEKSYKAAKANIDTLTQGKEFKVFNVKGDLGDNKTASIIKNITLKFDLSDYEGAKLYKIVGEEVDEVEDANSVRVSSSSVNFLLVYNKAGSSNSGAKKGCKSSLSVCIPAFILTITALGFVSYRKKENNL